MIFNELLEALMCADIPKRARRLIDVQMRFSFGCGPKTFTSLTTKDFAGLSDLDWSNAYRAITWLVEKNIFEKDSENSGRYRLNKLYHQWEVKVPLRDNPAYNEMLKKTVRRAVYLTDEPVKTTDDLPADLTNVCRNDSCLSVKTTDGHLSKRQMKVSDSSLQSDGCGLLKKKKRKGKENKDEEVFTYFFCHDLAGLLDGHSFFSGLKMDVNFWNTLAVAYPDQDIPNQINRMTAWLIANPNKRYKNYKRFIQGWLSRAARKENDYGKNWDDSAEKPAPFSDIPPELIA